MLEPILPFLKCPACNNHPLVSDGEGLNCIHCTARYPLRDGILDMIGEAAEEVITPFQRIMQTRCVAAIYEKQWRRLGYYLASSRNFDAEVATVLQLVSMDRRGATLDLACGPGVFTRPLAAQGRELVIGFDLSWPMLQQARRALVCDGYEHVFLVRGTVFRLPFVSDSFRTIVCCGALHLFAQPDPALEEIARVSAPDGQLCVQTTIRPEHSVGMDFLLERFIRFGFFSEEELAAKLRHNAFQIREAERHRISFTFLAQNLKTQLK